MGTTATNVCHVEVETNSSEDGNTVPAGSRSVDPAKFAELLRQFERDRVVAAEARAERIEARIKRYTRPK